MLYVSTLKFAMRSGYTEAPRESWDLPISHSRPVLVSSESYGKGLIVVGGTCPVTTNPFSMPSCHEQVRAKGAAITRNRTRWRVQGNIVSKTSACENLAHHPLPHWQSHASPCRHQQHPSSPFKHLADPHSRTSTRASQSPAHLEPGPRQARQSSENPAARKPFSLGRERGTERAAEMNAKEVSPGWSAGNLKHPFHPPSAPDHILGGGELECAERGRVVAAPCGAGITSGFGAVKHLPGSVSNGGGEVAIALATHHSNTALAASYPWDRTSSHVNPGKGNGHHTAYAQGQSSRWRSSSETAIFLNSLSPSVVNPPRRLP